MKNTLNVTTAGDREIVITRDFDAPRALVWETMSRPELLRRWLSGPPGWEVTACEDDPRVGGTFRWVWSGPEGAALTMPASTASSPRPCDASAPRPSRARGCLRWANSWRRSS